VATGTGLIIFMIEKLASTMVIGTWSMVLVKWDKGRHLIRAGSMGLSFAWRGCVIQRYYLCDYEYHLSGCASVSCIRNWYYSL